MELSVGKFTQQVLVKDGDYNLSTSTPHTMGSFKIVAQKLLILNTEYAGNKPKDKSNGQEGNYSELIFVF